MAGTGERAGAWVGVLTFLGGIALLALTFRFAFDLFSVPPDEALGLKPGKPLEISDASRSLMGIFVRIGVLLVMTIVASVIASRGIKLFGAALGFQAAPEKPVSKHDKAVD